MKKLFKNIANTAKTTAASYQVFHRRLPQPGCQRQRRRGLHRYRRQGADRRRSGRPGAGRSVRCAGRHRHAHRHPADSGDVQLRGLMLWVQALVFCGGLIYAAVDDLKTRTVCDIVCIIIAAAGLITISPASLLGALLAMAPFYLCAGLGLMGGGDWRLAAAVRVCSGS